MVPKSRHYPNREERAAKINNSDGTQQKKTELFLSMTSINIFHFRFLSFAAIGNSSAKLRGTGASRRGYGRPILERSNMRAGNNSIESYKASRQGDGLRIREDLPRITSQRWELLTPAETELLKWVGLFFRKPTPGRFMMRLRMPNGFAQSRQLRAIADLSRRLGNCVLDITTRQQIELRGFAIGTVPEIWKELRGVDLHSLQTGQDNVRNVNGCAMAGLSPRELFDASQVVFALDQMIVGLDGNPEFTNLPRKFNITITACLENCTHNESQDVALVPATKRGRLGFGVLVGGKMGSGGFTPATPLNVFVAPQQAAEVVSQLVKIFRDHGPRDARSKCRFRFLVDEWGVGRLRGELQNRINSQLEPAGRDMRRAGHADHLGAIPQKQPGLMAVGLCVPTGRLNPVQMEELARLAEDYGNGEIRLTVGQNAIVPNVPESLVRTLLREPLLKEFSPQPSPFFRRLVACTGTDFCNLAQIETKSRAVELSQALERKLGRSCEAASIHWSGCHAGCGNHQVAEIGLRGLKANISGKVVDAVAIYVGGQSGPDTRVGKQIGDVVPCDQLPEVLAALVKKRGLVRKPVERHSHRDFVPIELINSSQSPLPPADSVAPPQGD